MRPNVILKPMTPEMYHDYFREYQNDPDLFLDQSQCKPFVYSPEWVDAYIRRQADKGRKCFAVMAGDEMAGEVIIKDIEEGKSAVLGICMRNDSYKNRGIGTRAERLAIDYVFYEMNFPVLYADSILSNERSQHVLEKAGFRYLRTEGDFKYYAALRPEQEAGGKTAIIRKATGKEMLSLWGYPDIDRASPTARFFFENIASGNAVFWTMDREGALIGELYVFYDLADRDFADGKTAAYLCAFRVQKEFRGQGLGSRLMEAALTELQAMGFRRATVGVSPDEPRNIRLYRRHGFTRKVKDCHYDPCGMDEAGHPEFAETAWWLLEKDLAAMQKSGEKTDDSDKLNLEDPIPCSMNMI